jgi:hypothetical protein
MLTRANARDMARAAERQLNDRGYWKAKVDWQFEPTSHDRYDLVLTVVPGEAPKVRSTGETSLHPPKVYSSTAIDNYAAKLTSHYIALGYYDAKVNVMREVRGKNAMLNFDVVRGNFHRPIDLKAICGCLFRQRREAERKGIVDFNASLDESGVPDVQLGKPYTVGRISFFGNKHYSDSTVRRNLVLDEGVPLDSELLRRSLNRLNRSGMFETIDERQVQIKDTYRPGVADINIRLVERKHGAWNFSGPLPLTASISMRLPPWGQRMFELSSYAVSFNLLAYSSILKLTTARRFLPILALERPFTPGAGWLSGFAITPQIPWNQAANYLYTRFDRRISNRWRDSGVRYPGDVPPSSGGATLIYESPSAPDGPRMVLGRRNVIRSFLHLSNIESIITPYMSDRQHHPQRIRWQTPTAGQGC